MYFLDTYTIYQIAKGVESYSIFQKNIQIITSILNLYELYYSLHKENEKELAEEFFERLLPTCIDITEEDIKSAAKFRLRNIKKKISYIDALGYILALRNNCLFLTGDEAFRGVENVKFVK